MSPSAFLHPFARPAKERFVNIVSAEGATVYDERGKAYLDGMASLWYCNAGHGRHEIVAAITDQAGRLAAYNTFDPWTNPAAEEVAELIAQRSPLQGARVFLTSSGSEAVDSAIKLVRITQHLRGEPHRQLVVTREHAYHGVTYGGLSAQGIAANQAGFGALVPGFLRVPSDDVEAVARAFASHGDQIAAVLAEPVQGAGGVHPPAPGYLGALRRLCDAHGALLVLDEVVTGFGRLGSWFAAERYGVRPDLITFAKGVSSGYVPLGGVVISRGVCAVLEADPEFVLRHGHTYSGHPVAAAAGSASIRLLESEGLLERALSLGARLGEGLRALAADGAVAGARGEGAVWAVELLAGHDAVEVRDRLLELGVIARPLGQALAFCPPLVMSDAEVDRMVDALAEALGAGPRAG